MTKFPSRKKLTKEEKEKLLLELCQAMILMKDIKEAAQLLADLLSSQELTMIAKRLQVSKCLINGLTYQQIKTKLNVSHNTIARVNLWLKQAGEGYRLVAERSKKANLKPKEIPSKVKDFSPFTWQDVKRRYPSHFWPQLLLEEIVRSANQRQRKKLLNTLKVLEKANQKDELYQRLNKIMKNIN